MKTTPIKSTLIRCTIYSLLIVMFWNCKSPKSALEKEQYTKAMHLATKFIERGQDVDENTMYLQVAAKRMAEQTLQEYYQENGAQFADWKKSQGEFYRVLDQLGKRNIETNGLVSESYDMVCEVKQEIDLKIINYFYDEGIRLLDASINDSKKVLARDAYDQFISAEKEEAAVFYNNIEELKAECIFYGSITVNAPNDLRCNNIFLKPYNRSDGNVADCSINYHTGFIDFSTDSNENIIEKKKDIVTGQSSSTDTSGVVTYEDIIEEIVGWKKETTIEYTVTQSLSIDVIANTSECFLNDRSVTLSESDDCTEVEYTGDDRVFTATIDKDCNEFFIKNALERKLSNALTDNLYIN